MMCLEARVSQQGSSFISLHTERQSPLKRHRPGSALSALCLQCKTTRLWDHPTPGHTNTHTSHSTHTHTLTLSWTLSHTLTQPCTLKQMRSPLPCIQLPSPGPWTSLTESILWALKEGWAVHITPPLHWGLLIRYLQPFFLSRLSHWVGLGSTRLYFLNWYWFRWCNLGPHTYRQREAEST